MAQSHAPTSIALLVTAGVGLALFVSWTTGPSATAPLAGATQAATVAPGDATVTIPISAVAAETVVDGLPPAVARVLAEAGYLEALSAGEVGLAPAVARVLAAHGVVLSVSEGELTRIRTIPDLGPGSISEGVSAQ